MENPRGGSYLVTQAWRNRDILWRDSSLAASRMRVHDRSMSDGFQLSKQKIMAFVATRDPAQAREFYGDKLGLRLVVDQLPFALVYDVNGTMLRVSVVKELQVAGYTVLGWQVPDIAAAVRTLEASGVRFERFAGLPQNELGIWTAPGGDQVAWFKDPEGNILSVSQHVQ
jgi:catechol 2,3-dioxygenase-like lactoylglutathione lyase family enzyme